ncbi:hypothetical protein FOCC_FOCC001403 [Frankliniella occidentalis]|nr:hypothetical protein FOCC_FOCC001403 [Frankliniella occidentalis]
MTFVQSTVVLYMLLIEGRLIDLWLAGSALHLLQLYAQFAACQQVKDEALRTAGVVHRALLRPDLSDAAQQELVDFSVQLATSAEMTFSAWGLFTLGHGTMMSFLGTVATYIVIMVQFRGPRKPLTTGLFPGANSTSTTTTPLPPPRPRPAEVSSLDTGQVPAIRNQKRTSKLKPQCIKTKTPNVGGMPTYFHTLRKAPPCGPWNGIYCMQKPATLECLLRYTNHHPTTTPHTYHITTPPNPPHNHLTAQTPTTQSPPNHFPPTQSNHPDGHHKTSRTITQSRNHPTSLYDHHTTTMPSVAIFAGLAAAEPAKPNTGIQSYDVIDGKNHLLRARREPYTVRVSSLGGSHGAKSQIEASLVRPKSGIQSYDVIDGKNHLIRARREPYTVRVSSLGGSHGAKSQIEASLVRPKSEELVTTVRLVRKTAPPLLVRGNFAQRPDRTAVRVPEDPDDDTGAVCASRPFSESRRRSPKEKHQKYTQHHGKKSRQEQVR